MYITCHCAHTVKYDSELARLEYFQHSGTREADKDSEEIEL